jgi:hypothetical protein
MFQIANSGAMGLERDQSVTIYLGEGGETRRRNSRSVFGVMKA